MASLALFLAFFQTADQAAGSMSHTLEAIMWCVGVIALFFLLVMIGALVGAVKVYAVVQRLEKLAHGLEAKVSPLIAKTEGLVDDLSPKIQTIAANVEHISTTVRAKTDEIGVTVSSINETVADANLKTRAQVGHVNGIVSEALTTSQEVSRSIQNGIRVPIRQVAGVVAGLKVGLETWIRKMPFGRNGSAEPVEDTFVSTRQTPPSPYDL